MAPTSALLVASAKAGFDLLLIGHVACTIIGFGALCTTGIQARRLSGMSPSEIPVTLRRYFATGFNWAGRILYGVPVFGFLLLADSDGHLRVGDPWVVAGLALWSVAIATAEALVWPAEQRIQLALVEVPMDGPAPLSRSMIGDCRLVAASAAGLAVVFVTATVLMVARPG